MKRSLAAAFIWLIALASTSAAVAGERELWTTTWGASPAPAPSDTPSDSAPAFHNETIRQIVRLSIGGSRVRIRISNEFGRVPLHIGAAHVAIAADNGAILPLTDHILTFGGASSVDIPPGAPMISDPIDLKVGSLARLAVSLYLPEETQPCTCHGVGLETAYVEPGDQTSSSAFTGAKTLGVRAYLTGVDVEQPNSAGAIVALGDSLTDGVMSTKDVDRRWPDRLAERVVMRHLGVVNEGISGNRLLAGGAGDSAVSRFDRDVLANSNARFLIIFEGVNDLGLRHASSNPTTPALSPSAAQLIDAYRQLITRAHAHGLKVIGATVAPYGGAGYYTEQGEADRQAINQWIRTSQAFDDVVDFDAIWRDPDRPDRIRPDYDSGDHIHGSDAGYKALAEGVDLAIFQ